MFSISLFPDYNEVGILQPDFTDISLVIHKWTGLLSYMGPAGEFKEKSKKITMMEETMCN